MNRKIDEVGRIVIPAEIRKQLGIETGDDLIFEVEKNRLIIKKVDILNTIEYIYDLLDKEEDKHTRSVLTELLSQMEG